MEELEEIRKNEWVQVGIKNGTLFDKHEMNGFSEINR